MWTLTYSLSLKIWWKLFLCWVVEKLRQNDKPSTFARLFIRSRASTEWQPNWDRGMRVTFEYPPYSNPPRTCYNQAHSGCYSSTFLYICVLVILWTSSFELIRVRCVLIRSYSSLIKSHSCSVRTTSHWVLVKFNMHEWCSMQCEWPEYSMKAVRHTQ